MIHIFVNVTTPSPEKLIRVFRMIPNDFTHLRKAALKSFSFRISQNVIILLRAIPPITYVSASKTPFKRHQHPTKLLSRLMQLTIIRMHYLVIGFLIFMFAMGSIKSKASGKKPIDLEVLKIFCLLMA